jgi:hypothetical protein
VLLVAVIRASNIRVPGVMNERDANIDIRTVNAVHMETVVQEP